MEWIRFFEENNIHFVTRGPNTKRGELSVHCPFCGEEDPSEHLGISLTSENWGCLRDSSHRGKSARILIKNLLGVSSQQAGIIVKQYSHSDPDTLEDALSFLQGKEVPTLLHKVQKQKVDPEFNDFNEIKPRGVTKRFFTYLVDRGFDNPQTIIKQFNLKCALTGRYKDRIIIPVVLNGELLGWTSRALGHPVNAPRYLASSEDVKTTVLNYDSIRTGGKRLFIVEGPFDAMRMESYNLANSGGMNPVKFRATATFGTSVAISQIALLRALTKKYDETWILFDNGAAAPAANLAEWTGAKIAELPPGVKDPGELHDRHLDVCTHADFKGWFRTGQRVFWNPV